MFWTFYNVIQRIFFVLNKSIYRNRYGSSCQYSYLGLKNGKNSVAFPPQIICEYDWDDFQGYFFVWMIFDTICIGMAVHRCGFACGSSNE